MNSSFADRSMESLAPVDNSTMTSFDDVIGHEDVKLRMKQVLQPMLLPEHIVRRVFTGIRAGVSSLLLHGPPGCGKVSMI